MPSPSEIAWLKRLPAFTGADCSRLRHPRARSWGLCSPRGGGWMRLTQGADGHGPYAYRVPRRRLRRRPGGRAGFAGAAVQLRLRTRLRPSHAHRVPDSLELQEAGDLPRALFFDGAANNPLDVLRGESLQFGDVTVGSGHIERVHVHVRGEHRGKLAAKTGQQVDYAARNVRGGEHLRELDRRERSRLGRDDYGCVAPNEDGR